MTVRKPRQPETAADLLDAAVAIVGEREGQHGS